MTKRLPLRNFQLRIPAVPPFFHDGAADGTGLLLGEFDAATISLSRNSADIGCLKASRGRQSPS
jgi:hypothetical protein